jgi:hypothetical protein
MQTDQEAKCAPEIESNLTELNDLELAVIGGGIGDTAV